MSFSFLLKILSAFIVLSFGILTYQRNNASSVNRSFLKLTISIFLWLFAFAFAQSSSSRLVSAFLFKIGYAGITFIPATFYEFISNFLSRKRDALVSRILYALSIGFLSLLFFTPLLISGTISYGWGQYPKASSFFHPIFLIFYFSLFSISFVFLVSDYLRNGAVGNFVQTNRIKYVFIGSFVASFASIDFIPNYGFNIYPLGFIFILPIPVLFTYAIVRYRLMDINLAITRTGIFIVVYSFILGAPFILAVYCRNFFEFTLGANQWWKGPLVISTLLATIGPFLYLYAQKSAEKRMLQEQVRYQTTLRQASLGMGRIKDLKRLVSLIVHIVTRTVRLSHTAIYLREEGKQFKLGAARSYSVRFQPPDIIVKESPVIQELLSTKVPIVYDEIQQKTQDYGDLHLARVEKNMKELDAALIVPSFVDENLMGVIVLGKKLSGRPYSSDDLTVFSILASQSALAIENAQFYEDMKRTHEQLFKAEKMATIGTMADGLSHQINNRLHALGFIAGDVLDTVRLKKDLPMTGEIKEVMVDIEHALVRIQENVTQGGEIVQGLLKYTRKGEDGFAPVDLDRLLNAATEMTQFKIKPGEIKILREFKAGLPKINGNFTQLQEVFFNLIDNAYDAMIQKRVEVKDSSYEPTIRIFAEGRDKVLDVIVEDNGMGVKEDDKEKLFTPFFTTKLSSKKGTGLGLYVIRKLIEENHGGKVVYISRFGQGTRVYLTLPVAPAAVS